MKRRVLSAQTMSKLLHSPLTTQKLDVKYLGGSLRSEGVHALVDLPGPIKAFLQINILLGVVCCAMMFVLGGVLSWPYPYNFPLVPNHAWLDFVVFKVRFQQFHTLQFFSDAPAMGTTFQYPAPAALLYKGFYSIPRHPLPAFLLLTAFPVAFLARALRNAMVRRGIQAPVASAFVGSTLLVSYPFWFEYYQGNMEICIFLMLAVGIVAYLRDHFYLAAILIGLAASMKVFPFIYLALFLSRRHIRPLAAGVITALISNLVSLWLVCPSLVIAYRGIEAGFAKNRIDYMLRYLPVETGFDHSLFGFIKRAAHGALGNNLPPNLLRTYLVFSAFTGLALYFGRIRHLPILNQILCLCIAAILLPPTSHDYTLLHLYVPWALLLLYGLDRVRAKQDIRDLFPAFTCFAILFSPESEFILHGAGFSGQIKCVTLVVLLYIGLTQPLYTLTQEGRSQFRARGDDAGLASVGPLKHSFSLR